MIDVAAAQGISGLWENYYVFVVLVVSFVAGLGLMSRSFSVGAYGGYMVFAYIALETGTPLFEQILYVTLILIMVGMAFKVWRSEITGDGG